MISVKGLSKSFGDLHVIEDLSVTFESSTLYGLIGRNGSGKSTLLNCITGRCNPDKASIVFQGTSVDGFNQSERARTGIIGTFQVPRSVPSVSYADLHNVIAKKHCQPDVVLRLLRSVELGPNVQKQSLAQLSYGQQKVAGLLLAVSTNPSCLLLDEPVEGLSCSASDAVGLLLKAVVDTGMTVIMAEHNFEFVKKFSDEVILLDRRKITISGCPEQVFSSSLLPDAFK